MVSSNFHVSLFDDSHNPPEFPKELAVKFAEGFVDQLFEGDNDLVVDVDSMSAIGLPGGGFVSDEFALGENDGVYHNNYFAQVSVMEAIAGWLPLGLGAGGGTRPAGAPRRFPPPPSCTGHDAASLMSRCPRPPMSGSTDGRDDGRTAHGGGHGRAGARAHRSHGAAELRTGSPTVVDRAQPPAGRRQPGGPRTAGAAEQVEAHLAAEMPGHVVEKLDFVVRVRLSRKAIVATEGGIHAEAEVGVDPNRPLSVQVIGKTNVSIAGTGNDVFALPPGGGTSELTFTGQALAPGPFVVTIMVRQGTVPTRR